MAKKKRLKFRRLGWYVAGVGGALTDLCHDFLTCCINSVNLFENSSFLPFSYSVCSNSVTDIS